ncbi:helix-turn-helix domain-containing protein [Methylobacterium sp. A54F]
MISGSQITAARKRLGWSQPQLAERAKVPLGVVMRVEKSSGEPAVTVAQMAALVRTLRSRGIEFTDEVPHMQSAGNGG